TCSPVKPGISFMGPESGSHFTPVLSACGTVQGISPTMGSCVKLCAFRRVAGTRDTGCAHRGARTAVAYCQLVEICPSLIDPVRTSSLRILNPIRGDATAKKSE